MGEGKFVALLRVGERDDDNMIFEDWSSSRGWGNGPVICSRLYNEYLGGSGRTVRESMLSYIEGLRQLATKLEQYLPPEDDDSMSARFAKRLCTFDASLSETSAGMWCTNPIVAEVVIRSGEAGYACRDHLRMYRPLGMNRPGDTFIVSFEYLPGFSEETSSSRKRR